MARAKRSEWARRVRGLKQSGLSPEEYAAREGLNANTLRWWRGVLHREAKAPRAVTFVELDAAPVVPVDVLLSNGRVVRVARGFDDAMLARVLAVAER